MSEHEGCVFCSVDIKQRDITSRVWVSCYEDYEIETLEVPSLVFIQKLVKRFDHGYRYLKVDTQEGRIRKIGSDWAVAPLVTKTTRVKDL